MDAERPFGGLDAKRQSFVEDVVWKRVRSKKVLKAFESVDRALFTPPAQRALAYEDVTIDLGKSSTISQPSLSGEMVDHLDLSIDDKVLEVGTGSGYLAAVISKLACEVHSIEYDETLSITAQERLKRLGFSNVHVHLRDGALGLPEESPFSAIIVTAAVRDAPNALLKQLSIGGRIVLPMGGDLDSQRLVVGLKTKEGLIAKEVESVGFVPLISQYRGGWPVDIVDDSGEAAIRVVKRFSLRL